MGSPPSRPNSAPHDQLPCNLVARAETGSTDGTSTRAGWRRLPLRTRESHVRPGEAVQLGTWREMKEFGKTYGINVEAEYPGLDWNYWREMRTKSGKGIE
jgi:hypothetical protein